MHFSCLYSLLTFLTTFAELPTGSRHRHFHRSECLAHCGVLAAPDRAHKGAL